MLYYKEYKKRSHSTFFSFNILLLIFFSILFLNLTREYIVEEKDLNLGSVRMHYIYKFKRYIDDYVQNSSSDVFCYPQLKGAHACLESDLK